jgi:hypothetical protein
MPRPRDTRPDPPADYPFLCKGGDSGGPVDQNDAAWGIIEGDDSTSTWADLEYTQTNDVENGIGVTVLTS